MSEERLVPKLRFSGFDDEWVSYKIGDISKTYSGGTPSTSKREYYKGNIPFIKSGEIGNEVTEQYINEEAINNSSAKKVQKGDLLLALYGATSGEVAISKIDGAINQAVLKIDNKMNNYFQYNYFVKYKDQIIHKYLQGGQGNLSANIIKKLEFYYPNLEEQQKISNYLLLIDNKIELLEKKHHEYQNFKKYLMQQIFTQKLRFDFKDTWDKVLLKDVAFIPKKTKLTNVEGLKLLTVKLHTKGIEINDRIKPKLTKRGRPYYIRRSGELLIGRQNFHNGGMGIVPKSLDGGICSNAISSFNAFEDKIDVNYLYYFLARPEYYIKSERLIGGTGQKEFSEKELLKLKIDLPSLEEQNKIVDFLLNIDHKIELSENQLNKTQEFKKGLLQQMFIVRINWRCNFKLAKSPSFNKHLLILKNKIIFIIIE